MADRELDKRQQDEEASQLLEYERMVHARWGGQVKAIKACVVIARSLSPSPPPPPSQHLRTVALASPEQTDSINAALLHG